MQTKIFTTHPSQSFLKLVVQHILTLNSNKIKNIIVILPRNNDSEMFKDIFRRLSCNDQLPKIMSFDNIDKDYLLSNVENIKVISPMRRLILLMQFIELWNQEYNDNYSISLAYDLSSLLNEMYSNQINLSALSNLYKEESSEYWKKTSNFLYKLAIKWQSDLKTDQALDILEHKNLYIDHLINEWENDSQFVISAGVVFNKSFTNFLQALYKLPNSQIILPYINLSMSNQNWHSMSEEHYQYYFKNLLNCLSVNRGDIVLLSDKRNNILLEHLFDFDNFLAAFHTNRNEKLSVLQNEETLSNVELITCNSEQEESEAIVEIIRKNPLLSVQLFIYNKSLINRIDSLIAANEISCDKLGIDYLVATFLLYIVNVVISNCKAIELLSLLKHPFMSLGYISEEYNELLIEFEMNIIRFDSSFHFNQIKNSIQNSSQKLLNFWQKIEDSIKPLFCVKDQSIDSILSAHIISMLDLSRNNDLFNFTDNLESFIANFKSACKGIKVCTLNKYREILLSILHGTFFEKTYQLSCVNLIERDVVIFAGFNDGDYPPNNYNNLLNRWMRNKIGLPNIDEENGYFALKMYSFFYAKKVYITRSLKCTASKTIEESIWLKRFKVLLQIYNIADLTKKYNEKNKVNSLVNFGESSYEKDKINLPFEVKARALKVLPVTALRKLIDSPYIFYINYILNIVPVREINRQISIKDFGIIVHKILQKYSLSDRISENNRECYNLLLDIARPDFFSISGNYPYVEAIWWPKFEKIAQQFVNIDLQRRVHIEQIRLGESFTWSVTKDTAVVVKCDRVEYLKDGTVAIIDYKTGSIPSQSEIQKDPAPEIIIQALAVQYNIKRKISQVLYWKVGTEPEQLVSVEHYSSLMEIVEKYIKQYLTSFLYESLPIFATPINVEEKSRYKEYELLLRNSENKSIFSK